MSHQLPEPLAATLASCWRWQSSIHWFSRLCSRARCYLSGSKQFSRATSLEALGGKAWREVVKPRSREQAQLILSCILYNFIMMSNKVSYYFKTGGIFQSHPPHHFPVYHILTSAQSPSQTQSYVSTNNTVLEISSTHLLTSVSAVSSPGWSRCTATCCTAAAAAASRCMPSQLPESVMGCGEWRPPAGDSGIDGRSTDPAHRHHTYEAQLGWNGTNHSGEKTKPAEW